MSMQTNMRIYHRYLGFFLAGIMALYAISGTILIFRKTDFLKSEKQIEKTMPADFKTEELGKIVKLKDFKIEKEENGMMYFKNGTYNATNRNLSFKTKELPAVLEKMTKIHKATSDDPFYYLNIFFGFSLLFFVVSSFWMFLPGSTIFKKGMYFTLAGFVLALILLLI